MAVHDENKVSRKKHWGEKLSMQSNCHFLVEKGEERSTGGSPERREIKTQRDEKSQDVRMGRRGPTGSNSSKIQERKQGFLRKDWAEDQWRSNRC